MELRNKYGTFVYMYSHKIILQNANYKNPSRHNFCIESNDPTLNREPKPKVGGAEYRSCQFLKGMAILSSSWQCGKDT